MPDPLAFSDYPPPARPLADDRYAALQAVALEELSRTAGVPEPFLGRIFSDEAVALAREGRIASGAPGSDGTAVLREGVHPSDGARYLVFPRPLPRRALIRMERDEVRRFLRV
jgi:hypothetical protein